MYTIVSFIAIVLFNHVHAISCPTGQCSVDCDGSLWAPVKQCSPYTRSCFSFKGEQDHQPFFKKGCFEGLDNGWDLDTGLIGGCAHADNLLPFGSGTGKLCFCQTNGCDADVPVPSTGKRCPGLACFNSTCNISDEPSMLTCADSSDICLSWQFKYAGTGSYMTAKLVGCASSAKYVPRYNIRVDGKMERTAGEMSWQFSSCQINNVTCSRNLVSATYL